MKKLLIFAISNFLVFTAIAQQWRVVEIVEDMWPKKIITSKYYYDYSRDRGSSKMADTILYDSFKVFVADANGVKQEPFTCVNKYDNNNNLVLKTVNTDTGKFSEERMLYNAKDQLTDWYSCRTMYAQSGIVYGCASEAHNTYDANDMLAATVYNYSALLTDSADQQIDFTYDVNNNLVLDSAFLLNPSGKKMNTFKHHYTYDNNNNLTAIITLKLRDGIANFDTVNVEQHTYNTQNQLVTTTGRTKFSTSIRSTAQYKYYPDGNLMSVGQNFYEYTSFGMVSMRVFGDVANPNPPRFIYYYYEHYWPAGVEHTARTDNEVVVYPIPASGLVNITAHFNIATDIKGTLTDVQGRVLRSWSETGVQNYRKQLPVSSLAAGNYFITLHTNTGKITRQFVVE